MNEFGVGVQSAFIYSAAHRTCSSEIIMHYVSSDYRVSLSIRRNKIDQRRTCDAAHDANKDGIPAHMHEKVEPQGRHLEAQG